MRGSHRATPIPQANQELMERRWKAKDGSDRLLRAILAYYRKHHHPTLEKLG